GDTTAPAGTHRGAGDPSFLLLPGIHEVIMAGKHVVRFEPVGIEIEVDEEQNVLRAAAEQGIMLMHGCKEGQCSSCKSFLLDGDDVELDSYSTFALPDFEKEEGFTLLCRAHVYEDVTIELLNYDEDMIRSGLPIKEAVAEVVANDPVTRDMRHLVLKLVDTDDFKFFPGQYVDIAVPGTNETRSFSMANTSARESGQLEFIIKIYPRTVLPLPRHQGANRRPAQPDRAVRGLHLARRPRHRPRFRRRRGRDGADLVPAPVHGRARHRAQGRVLLRRPPPRRSLLRR